MNNKVKKTFFLLYPFIGFASVIKWFFLGIWYVITLPFSLIKPKKKSTVPQINEVTNQMKRQRINDLMNALPENEAVVQNEKELPMLSEDILNDNLSEDKKNIQYTVNSKNKKEIMRSKKIAYKKEQKRLKEERKNAAKINSKLLSEKETLQKELSSGNLHRSASPVAFRYKAIDKKGKLITSTFMGTSKLDVNAYLINEGYDVYDIKTSKFINFVYGQSSIGVGKIKTKDLIFWLTQLHTYVKAGVPLTDAVKILANQMGKKPAQKRVFDKIVYELTMGSSFSAALEKQNNMFPSLLINMIKAAEATGELEETLGDMAAYYSDIEATRKQMISALTYPAIITVFALAVVVFMLVYVIPQFTQVYDQAGAELNGLTSAIIAVSDFIKNYYSYILLLVTISIIILVLCYKKFQPFRKNLQILLMHIPVVSKVIIYKEMTLFTKTFASLLKNNVMITESVEILSKVTSNEVYKQIMYSTINNIAKGEKISESFKNNWAIPDIAYFMIVTGESTGELAQMMDNVSVYYQEQHRAIVGSLKAFIEPIMIVSLALIVGVIIMAVIIPMFDLYSEISM